MAHTLQRRLVLRALGWAGVGLGAGLAGCSAGPGVGGVTDTPAQVPTGKTYPVAWVLSSGGPRGFVHVGVLKGLAELGLKPDLVVGSSVGALVGCLYAAGVPVAELERLAMQANVSSLFRLNLFGEGWVHGGGLAELVNTTLKDQRLQDLPTAFAAVALATEQDQLIAFNWGNAGLAVQAACAIEGRLAPVRLQGKLYVDADRLSPMPVRMAQQLGAQRVLAVDASAHEQLAPPGAQRYREFDQRKRQMTQIDAELAQLVLHPDIGYYTGTSTEYRERSIRTGYEFTLKHAKALQALHQPG